METQLKESTILESLLLSSNERVNRTNILVNRLESVTRRLGLNTEPCLGDKTAVERAVQPLLEEIRLSFNEETDLLNTLETLIAQVERL